MLVFTPSGLRQPQLRGNRQSSSTIERQDVSLRIGEGLICTFVQEVQGQQNEVMGAGGTMNTITAHSKHRGSSVVRGSSEEQAWAKNPNEAGMSKALRHILSEDSGKPVTTCYLLV